MADLDVHVDNKMFEGINELAVRHYGDDSRASQGRVVEAALCMRLLWASFLMEGKDGDVNQFDEPVTKWEFDGGSSDLSL